MNIGMLIKEIILDKISEASLIRHIIPTFNPVLDKNIHKSIYSKQGVWLSFFISSDGKKWKFKNNTTGHEGDVFSLWGDYYGLDYHTQLPDILDSMNNEMALGLKVKQVVLPATVCDTASNISNTRNFQIEYLPVSDSYLSQLFLAYWAQFGITQGVLEKFEVRQVAAASFVSNAGRLFHFHYFTQKKVAMSYHIGGRVKIYVPEIPPDFFGDVPFTGQKKSFDYKNQIKSDVFGLAQLPSGHLPYILFTAGEQDCMIAHAHGFNAIALQAQNQMPTAELMQDLYGRSAVLLSCYGNNTCGFQSSNHLENLLGIAAIRLPENVKDIAEYFQKYSTESFTALLEEGVAKSKSVELIQASLNKQGAKKRNNLQHKLKKHLYEIFEFRYNIIALDMEIRSKQEINQWQKLNISALCLELNKRQINISCSKLKSLLQSLRVPEYNPIQSYFLAFETKKIDTIDYIMELAQYVILEDASDTSFECWYINLKKWMIRAIRSIFEDGAINNHALILTSKDRNVTKNPFCELLTPSVLIQYYTNNLVLRDKKACQLSLASSFIINLQELHQFKSYLKALKLQSFIDQTNVRVCLPYQKNTVLRPRVASFVGTISALQLLRHSNLNTNHFIRFCISGTKDIDDRASVLLELAWQQAYHLYKKNNKAGTLNSEELKNLQQYQVQFGRREIEIGLLNQYIAPASEGKGTFMKTTDILDHLQKHAGPSVKLNKIALGRAIKELGFKRLKFGKLPSIQRYGYWVSKKSV